MTIPRATYRLQFHKGFTFADAARQATYFAALGISHIYASPILTARAGSLHGYDVVDHSHINPELGGEEGLRALVQTLKQHELGLIVDIVPNHMAVGGADNRWWLDVLENGRGGAFADAFDIDWDAPGLQDRILAPFLDGTPQAAWRKGDLELVYDQSSGKWAFAYFQHRFPLRPQDRAPPLPCSWQEAKELLARQHYVLADWRDADSRINWRRFFDITDLAALRIAEPAVFDAVHGKILALYGEGLIDGVRIDHVDGLAGPAAYCRHLRARLTALRPDPYIIVEKILAEGEALPTDWGVDGTTGYDVMNDISALQHADDGGMLEQLWQQASGRNLGFEAEETLARQEILASKFAAQRDAGSRAFARVLPNSSPETLKAQLQGAIVALRCYRGYQTGGPDTPAQTPPLVHALAQAPALQPVFEDRSGDPAVRDALRRFHQLSAPVAAKAVEDTAFYRYGRLLSRNDVGFDPRRTFLTPTEFHTRAQARARDFPFAMLATATHDHKRGEDARARLAALGARRDLWEDFFRQAPADPRVHPADAYVLYQTLLGAWPSLPDAAFADRIAHWARKHLREGKLRSSWQAPDDDYEEAFCGLARRLILDAENAAFRARLGALLATIAGLAEDNALVQTVLRNTLPGVPDLFQGTEFADHSLVDPDNRRPVDYAARSAALAAPLPSGAPFDHRKQRLIARLLAARRQNPDLWGLGDYVPAPAPPGLIAFQRHYDGQGLFVVARCNGGKTSSPLTVPWTGEDTLSGRTIADGDHQAAFLLARWPALVLFARNVAA